MKKYMAKNVRDNKNGSIELYWDTNIYTPEGMDIDEQQELKNKNIRNAAMLYVPNKMKFEHYHIDLLDEEVLIIRDWCNKFLKMKKEIK
jgi:hypothetical protein